LGVGRRANNQSKILACYKNAVVLGLDGFFEMGYEDNIRGKIKGQNKK
jgi:hypothetical protein